MKTGGGRIVVYGVKHRGVWDWICPRSGVISFTGRWITWHDQTKEEWNSRGWKWEYCPKIQRN